MGNAESKLALKNRVFTLAGSPANDDGVLESTFPYDDPFWNMFWEEPNSAEDVFSLLTYEDIINLRNANKQNFFKLVRVIVFKLITTARNRDFPNNTTAQPRHILNCIRVLNRLIPFLFEMTTWEKEINNLFWNINFNSMQDPATATTGFATVGSYSTESRGADSLESSSIRVNIDAKVRKEPNSTDAQVGQGAAGRPLGQDLLNTLLDLLFTRDFTLEATAMKGPDFKMWEAGIGASGKYTLPDPRLDSNRLEVLRLIITICSQGLYLTPKSTVSQGSRFLTLLVATIPRLKSLTLICSLLNTVCRSCKPDGENNGLTYSAPVNNHQYSHQKFYELRKTFVGYSLQLLTIMLVYPIPQQDRGFLHHLNIIPLDEKPHNMVRSYLGRLYKENELNFIYSSFVSLLVKPIQTAVDNESNPFSLLKNNFSTSPTSQPTTSGNQGVFSNGLPALSSWSTEIVIVFWELVQCNKHFKSFVYSKKIQELMVTTLYYIKYYRNDPLWRSNLVRVMCYFMLYLSSDDLVASRLLLPFSTNYYTNLLPAYYKLDNQTLPSNLSYRDFLVIQICNMLTNDEFDIIITPILFEYLYNLIPIKNDDPNVKIKTTLSYNACLAILKIVNRYANEEFLKDQLKLDLLALIVRAIAHAISRYHKESRTLLYALVRYEKVVEKLYQNVQLITMDDNESPEPASTSATQKQSNVTSRAGSPGNVESESEAEDAEEEEGTEDADTEFEQSLRPTPPTGMSSKAKSKLPMYAPLSKNWAGYRALMIIRSNIKLIKKEVPDLGDGSRTAVIQTLFLIENIPEFQNKISKFTTSEFLPKTKFEQLRFIWSNVSLGWYESILWGVIFYQNLSMSRESMSSMWYKRNSAISLKDVASSWGFNWKTGAKDKQIQLFQFDNTILQLNIWNGTNIKLFKIKKPVPEKPLVDMTNLMRRFRLNSAASVQTVESRNSMGSLARQTSHSGLNSPNLTPINSRQSFSTPRNSLSVARDHRPSLSRQNTNN